MVEVSLFVQGAIAFVVTQGVKLAAFHLFKGKDLSGFASFITFILTAGALGSLQAIVDYFPGQRETVEKILEWAVMILGGSGAFRIYAKMRK
jgi:hypothetical protein